ncbi:PAS domain-containing protein [Halorientalis pallida]|uniref:PAS domain-containing protein n=1 Tax=Halorientalis pallida TaxID=2479928 RepID=UPI003C702EA8
MADESTGAEAPVSGWQEDPGLVGTLARTAGVACFRLDSDRRLRAVTERVVDLTGQSREALLGEHVDALFDPADAARAEIGLRRLAADGEGVESVAVTVTADGATTPCTLRLGRAEAGVVGVLQPHEDRDDVAHAQFEEMVDYVADYAIFALDTDGTVVSWNTGAERIKGYAAEEIIGEQFDVFYTDADREAGVPGRNLAEAVAEGRVEDEGWRVRKDGGQFWANVVITAIRDDDGDLDGFIKITRDMTERREQARRIERERNLFEQVLDAAPVDILVVDADGDVIRTNTPEDVTRQPLENLTEHDVYTVDGDPIPPEQRPSRTVFETGDPVYDRELRVELPERGRLFLSVTAVPLTDDEGRVDRAVVIVEDVTRLKSQAKQLERERDELRAELDDVFARISDGFYGLDAELRFSFVNERAAELLGIAEHEVLGNDIRDELDPTERFEAALEEALDEQTTVTIEDYYPPLDAWFENTIYPTETGLSVYFRDVTERKEREQELDRSRRRYRTLVEQFPNGVVTLFDENLRYLLAGGEGFADYPFDAGDLEGERVDECVPPALAEQVRPHYEAVFDGEERCFEVTFRGRVLQFHAVPVRDGDGRVVAGMGMSQDVTEQRRRERELETRVRQQAVVTELGQYALAAEDLDTLFAEAVTAVAETLDTDYCKVLELQSDGEMHLRAGVGWRDGLVGTATVGTDRDSQAGYTLLSEEPVVVDDLRTETRFSGPDLLTSHDVRSGVSVVVGTPERPWGVLGTHDTDPEQFSEQDVAFVQAVANILTTAIERVGNERKLRRQREQLAALNNLNAVGRDIIRALLRQSTREEVETLVCERLADSDSYAFAWVGAVDETEDVVVARAEAGVTDYLGDTTIRVDDSEDAQGPTGQAFRTGELQVCQNVRSDPDYAQWRDRAREYGYRASAAVPISAENTVYGVLNVYTERADAFGTEERAVLGGLGDVMGHAINAIERQRLLMSDEITEVEFRIRDLLENFGLEAEPTGTVTVAETIPTGGDTYLAYGSASDGAQAWLERLVDVIPHWRDLTYVGTVGGDPRFEIHLDDPPILSLLSAHGGRVKTARITDGDYHMTVELPPDASVRTVVDGVQAVYPEAEMLVQRRTTLDGRDGGHHGLDLDAILTERQLAAVEASYYAGFFEWPRESTGEEVADALGISPPTFHQHLRAAEGRILAALLGDSGTDNS